jgi:carbon storage regulator
MLILARRIGEAIMVDDNIKVIVLRIKGNQIWMGIKASEDIKVYREEVYQRIQEEKRHKQEDRGDV